MDIRRLGAGQQKTGATRKPYRGQQRIIVPDTPWNRKVMDVIEGRKTLDDIVKNEKQLG